MLPMGKVVKLTVEGSIFLMTAPLGKQCCTSVFLVVHAYTLRTNECSPHPHLSLFCLSFVLRQNCVYLSVFGELPCNCGIFLHVFLIHKLQISAVKANSPGQIFFIYSVFCGYLELYWRGGNMYYGARKWAKFSSQNRFHRLCPQSAAVLHLCLCFVGFNSSTSYTIKHCSFS